MHPEAERKSRRFLPRRFHVGPVFKALLISVAVEFSVLLATFEAVGSYVMRDSAAAPRPMWEDLLAGLGLAFHLPSILIVIPLGMIFAAPLVQVALMTYVLGLVFRARERARARRRSLPVP